MVRKREIEVNLMIKEVYELFNQSKLAQGYGQIGDEMYWGEINFFLKTEGLCESDYISIITEQMVNDWIIKMRQSNLSDSSVNHNIRCARVFLYWAMNNNYIKRFKIKTLKVQEEKIKYCTDEEIEKLLSKVKTDDFVETRTYTIICFILATGARSATVRNIKLSDLDFKNNMVTFRHMKTKQVLTVPLTNQIVRILQSYLHSWDTESKWLFSDVKSGQLTSTALKNSMARYCKRRGLRVIYPHELRHTFARLFVVNGGDSLILQKFLGHSSLDMTRRYVRLFSEELHHANLESYIPLNLLTSSKSRTRTVRRAY